MKIVSWRIPAVVLAAALLAPPVLAQPVATRNGNTWAGTHHQPTEAQVRQREKAAGVEPSQAQRDATASTIHHLNQEILDQSRG